MLASLQGVEREVTCCELGAWGNATSARDALRRGKIVRFRLPQIGGNCGLGHVGQVHSSGTVASTLRGSIWA